MQKTSYEHLPRLEVYRPDWLTDEKLEELAERIFYRGSEEHKGSDNSFGFSHRPPRRYASECDSNITREQAQEWLRTAVRKGNIQWTVPEEKHPRYVWGLFNNQLFLARLTNDGKGEYKGYPVQVPVTVKGMVK